MGHPIPVSLSFGAFIVRGLELGTPTMRLCLERYQYKVQMY
jgi:hypothetical protein